MSEGTIEQTEELVRLRYVRQLGHPVEVVWEAITEPDEIERWTGSRPEIELRVGGEYVTYHGDQRQRVVDHVVRLERPRLFEHTFWVHVNPSALVTWELSPAQGGTRLVLTHALDRADIANAAATVAAGDHPVTIMARNAAGWHRLLDRLEATVDRRDVDFSHLYHQLLQDRYTSMLRA